MLGWSELSCDGGHTIDQLTIRYKEETDELLVSSYRYLYNLNPSLRNYTIQNLEPETPYTFAVQAVSAEFLPSHFSDESTINTLLPGNHNTYIVMKPYSDCMCSTLLAHRLQLFPMLMSCQSISVSSPHPSSRCQSQISEDTSSGGDMERTCLSSWHYCILHCVCNNAG